MVLQTGEGVGHVIFPRQEGLLPYDTATPFDPDQSFDVIRGIPNPDFGTKVSGPLCH